MAEAGQQQHAVLDYYFDHVTSLDNYLRLCLDEQLARQLVCDEDDPHSYVTLLRCTQVAWNGDDDPRPSTAESSHVPSLGWSEIIRHAQTDILAASSRPDDVLCYGYTLQSGNVTNRTSNTGLTEVQESSDWKLLLRRASPSILLHLLRTTSVFVQVKQESLRQICGKALHNVPISGKRHSTANDLPKAKRHKQSRVSSASATVLDRQAIFYSNLVKKPCSERGLGLNNALQATTCAFPDSQKKAYQDDLAPARHLSKHIWPRLYGIEAERKTHNKIRLQLDAAILSKGPVKTPEALKNVLPLLQDMLNRHRTFNYARVRERLIPSTIKHVFLTQEEKILLFESISEDSAPPLTQGLTGPMQDPNASSSMEESLNFQPVAPSQRTRKQGTQPPRFVEFAARPYQVIKYLQTCVAAVVPMELLGSRENTKSLDQALVTFVQARQNETISMADVMRHFRTSHCAWAIPGGPTQRRPATACVVQAQLVQDLIFWIVDNFIVDILRTMFYVTESSAYKRRTLYFLQEDWRIICQPLVDNMTSSLFQKIDAQEALSILSAPSRKLSFSHVRLLPKEKGVRPIVNLSRRTASGAPTNRGLSINQLLQNAFAVLNYEKKKREELVGSATQSFTETYKRLKAYKCRLKEARLKEATSHGTRLYMVKLDIRACFDTIEQDKLLEILEVIIQNDDYDINRYATLARKRETVMRRFAKEARTADEFASFPEIAFQLADAIRGVIFVDQVRPLAESRAAVLALLREHIKENIIKIGDNYYRQSIGIAQGSVLSTLLCNFFYGYMEKTELAFTHAPYSLLLRLVDDFLFITTKREDAERFLRKMHAGHPEYGCFVSIDKTLVNFDVALAPSEAARRITPKAMFPWCGHLLHQKHLEVQYDYSRLAGCHLTDTLSVRRHRKPGEAFLSAMLTAVKVRTNIIFFDTSFTRLQTVYLNIYQAFQLVAMKYHSYITIWKPSIDRNISFFLGVVHRVVAHFSLSIRTCFEPKIVQAAGATAEGIQRSRVAWLGYHAFLKVLLRKPAKFRLLLRQLKLVCAMRASSTMVRSLRPVLAHPSNQQLQYIRY